MYSITGQVGVRLLNTLAAVLAGLTLSACGVRETAGARQAFSSGFGDAPFNLATDCMQGSQNENGACVLPAGVTVASNASYTRISSLTDPAAQVLWRNRFQDYLVWRSEQQCQLYKLSIISTQNGVNFALNSLVTGAAGVAAIVVAPAANILGAIAAITNGIRGHFNEDFYQRLIAPAIINQIQIQRTAALTTMMLKRRSAAGDAPIQSYTLEEAVGDAERYHQLCSATLALSVLIGDQNKFADTSAGVQARIRTLQAQIDDNVAQIGRLKAASDPKPFASTIQQLTDANNDIAKQISILQRQMLTAPSSPLTGDVVSTPARQPGK